MARWNRVCVLIMMTAALRAAGDARAAEPSAEDRERARTLLLDGRAKLKAGDAEAAVKAFRAAHAIMNVPTTGLDLARGLVEIGRLIEARTVALEVTRSPAAPDEPEAFTNARAGAAKLAEELAGRIPSLVIEVSGPPGAGVVVSVDGSAVPSDALGLPWKVDPGEHEVEASAAGAQGERQTVRVEEGESLPVKLALSAEERPAAETPAWAWVSGGVGIAALGAGIAFAADYAGARSTAAEDCPNNLCDPTRYDAEAADALEARWNRDLGLALGLGAIGLAGIGTAIYGIVTARPPAPSDAAITPWIGRDAAGVTFRSAF